MALKQLSDGHIIRLDEIASMIARRICLTTGGFGIFLASFFSTLFILSPTALSPDDIRAQNAKEIMAALEKYRATIGAYPILPVPDSITAELSKPLVNGGYISSIPLDPTDKEPTRYVSFDGKSFGLRVFQNGAPCLIEVRASKTGWWSQPPPCKFAAQ